jgi:hypothetical protein
MVEREDRETKQDQKNYRLARANGCFSDQSGEHRCFYKITVTKARARAARASQRGSSKRHGIVSPRLEGELGPTYEIGDDAQRARTRQI